MKALKTYVIITVVGLLVQAMWNSVPVIKNFIHLILDPTFGALMNFNILFGMASIVCLITLITTLFQKYGTNQEELRRLKGEQKLLQVEMKKYKDNPEKFLELQKKSMEFIPKTMELTMKPLLFTFIPFLLFFRWFNDYFALLDYKFFGFISWFWFYFIASIVFSSILRKVLKVA